VSLETGANDDSIASLLIVAKIMYQMADYPMYTRWQLYPIYIRYIPDIPHAVHHGLPRQSDSSQQTSSCVIASSFLFM